MHIYVYICIHTYIYIHVSISLSLSLSIPLFRSLSCSLSFSLSLSLPFSLSLYCSLRLFLIRVYNLSNLHVQVGGIQGRRYTHGNILQHTATLCNTFTYFNTYTRSDWKILSQDLRDLNIIRSLTRSYFKVVTSYRNILKSYPRILSQEINLYEHIPQDRKFYTYMYISSGVRRHRALGAVHLIDTWSDTLHLITHKVAYTTSHTCRGRNRNHAHTHTQTQTH